MGEIIAHHSGKSIKQVMRDIDRDYFMTPEEAVAYGLIDGVIAPRRGLGALLSGAVPSLSGEGTPEE
jgi:ATP-dependent protease ClpP protease subunit